jgi:oligoribonuclease NrnB/cAMP/cGMP phosphodiesterase (DHH superfamily)
LKGKAIVLITDGDLDGTSSRILLEWFLIPFNKVLIQQSRIGFDFKLLLNQLDLSKIDVIGFADLAPDPLIYSHLLTFPNLEVHIWDHHVTSRQTLNSLGLPNKNYHYEEDKCSSLNIYNYFKDCGNRPYKKIVHDFAKYVNIWDIWLSDDKDFYWAKGLHNLLYKTCNKYGYERGYTQFVNVQLKKFECLDEYEFFDDELKMIKEEQEREDSYFERAS